jgi:hypothetical protein
LALLICYLKQGAFGTKEGRILLDAPGIRAFEELKEAFGKAILLIYFSPEKQILVETDSSGAALVGSLF